MARPIKKVDTQAITKLAQLHCTYDEIAEFCDVSTKTLQRNYVHLIKKGREMGRIQHLDQKDKIEQTSYNEPLPLIIEAKKING